MTVFHPHATLGPRALAGEALAVPPRRACGDGEEEAKGAQAELQRASLAAGWQPVPRAALALLRPRVAGAGGAGNLAAPPRWLQRRLSAGRKSPRCIAA